MRRIRSRFAALTVSALCAFAAGSGCGGESPQPISPTPPAPTFSPPTVTGTWRGTLRQTADYFTSDVPASVTLNQTGSSVTAVVRCGGHCLFSGITVAGTVTGNSLTVEGTHGRWGTCRFEGTFSPTHLQGTYDCGQPFTWQLTKVGGSGEESPPCIPQLLSPSRDVLMDNGRVGDLDAIDWVFDWSDCPGATYYSVYVLGPGATLPLINDVSPESSYRRVSCGGYIFFTAKWRLWLRAMTDDVWGDWSPEYNFDVEPANTDPLARTSCAANRSLGRAIGRHEHRT